MNSYGDPTFYNCDLPHLYPGDEDDMVYVVQSILDSKGYAGCGERCPYNGVMDENTVYALNSFKLDMRLNRDGTVDSDTWRMLFGTYIKQY